MNQKPNLYAECREMILALRKPNWTEEEAAAAWNAQADVPNQWCNLSGVERDEWIATKNILPEE